jgi:ABC-type amino acid transport substrate-binding protein
VNKYCILFFIALFGFNRAYACELTVATPNIPPHFWTENGKAKGLTVDFLNLVAQQSGCQFTYKAKPWKRVLHELTNGGVDMTVAFHSESREGFAYYSTAKFGQYQFYIFSLDPNNKRQSVDSLYAEQKKLMYLKDWYLGDLKQKIVSKADLAMPILSLDKGLKLMIANRADAILGPKVEMLYSIKQNKLTNKVFLSSTPQLSLDQYVVFSKHSVPIEIYHQVNAAISVIVASGKMKELIKKYTH